MGVVWGQAMTSEPPPKRPSDNPWRQVGAALGTVFTIPAAVAVGAIAGIWLDNRFDMKPLFTLLLTGVGFAGGLLEVLRVLRKASRP